MSNELKEGEEDENRCIWGVARGWAENVKVIQTSDLEWTVVRYPRLKDGEHTRKFRVGFVSRESGTQLSRADGADFVLKELIEKKWVRKLPLVSY